MGAPPSAPGAAQETAALALPGTAVSPVGAPGMTAATPQPRSWKMPSVSGPGAFSASPWLMPGVMRALPEAGPYVVSSRCENELPGRKVLGANNLAPLAAPAAAFVAGPRNHTSPPVSAVNS